MVDSLEWKGDLMRIENVYVECAVPGIDYEGVKEGERRCFD
jgi:hypothetical protein